MKINTLALVAAAVAAAQSIVPAQATSPAGDEAIHKAGKVMFEHRCRSCHADDAAAKSYGPSLIGVFGRKAGSVPGFGYSDAMKASGITWNEDALRKWIANNTEMLPGTRMKHMNVTDRLEQDFLITYLKTLK